jgi:plasmid maintenance system antidote protein VapI
MKKNLLPSTTPGEVLAEEFVRPLGNLSISAGEGFWDLGAAYQ